MVETKMTFRIPILIVSQSFLKWLQYFIAIFLCSVQHYYCSYSKPFFFLFFFSQAIPWSPLLERITIISQVLKVQATKLLQLSRKVTLTLHSRNWRERHLVTPELEKRLDGMFQLVLCCEWNLWNRMRVAMLMPLLASFSVKAVYQVSLFTVTA